MQSSLIPSTINLRTSSVFFRFLKVLSVTIDCASARDSITFPVPHQFGWDRVPSEYYTTPRQSPWHTAHAHHFTMPKAHPFPMPQSHAAQEQYLYDHENVLFILEKTGHTCIIRTQRIVPDPKAKCMTHNTYSRLDMIQSMSQSYAQYIGMPQPTFSHNSTPKNVLTKPQPLLLPSRQTRMTSRFQQNTGHWAPSAVSDTISTKMHQPTCHNHAFSHAHNTQKDQKYIRWSY